MNKVVSDIRLFLFTCSGEDNYILKRCNWGIQKRFALIGFFVLLIFIGCFFSATLFSYSLFQGARWTSVPIGVLWGAIVVNMYLLLLHTISPAIIPLACKKKNKNDNFSDSDEKPRFFTLSMFSRLGFMMLLAIIIAQPLNFSILSSTVKTHLDKHKIHERVKLYALTNGHLVKSEIQNQKDFNDKVISRLNSKEVNLFSEHLKSINIKIDNDKKFITISSRRMQQLNEIDSHVFLNKIENQKKALLINEIEMLLNQQISSDEDLIRNLNTIQVSGMMKSDFDNYKSSLVKLVTEKVENYNKLNSLLEKSNFYIKTIQLLLIENPLSWIITIIVCFVFLLPIYFKYKARDISAKLFIENQKDKPELIKLREELINTKDFTWLETKLKMINIREIRTSDYYFQRMLIEHKIILEEYDETKKTFSKLLEKSIKRFNSNSLSRLLPLLEKLKRIDLLKYQEFHQSIFDEYKDETIIKYEYWLDCPFRTKRVYQSTIVENQVGLLDFVYNSENEEKI